MSPDLLIIVVSLLFSAFFSGMEIAYVSADRVQVSIFKAEDSWSARAMSKLLSRPDKYIATTLVGNNIVLVIYGYYMGAVLIRWLFPQYIDSDELPFDVLLVQTLISTGVILLTGEFVPKVVFRIYSVGMLRALAIPMYIIYRVLDLLYITDFILWISSFMIRKVFRQQETQALNFSFGRVDLGYYIEQQMENLDTEQRSQMDKEINIFRNALDFRDVKARECMVPRTEMRTLEIGAPMEEFKRLFISSGLSKIVVYRDSVDNVVGYVHSFDFFRPVESIQDILLPVLFVPESMPVNEILKDLTQKRMSIAVVLDEYGGTSGMITVEDIIEELLGDIEDEHDKDLLLEKDLGGGQYLFSARQEVDYLNQRYDLGLPESEEYETLGGLILAHTEKIPQKDEQVEIGDFVFTIREVSSAKIETVHLRKKHAE
ncbi:MAG TPA: HlyC/CorC family transporter [Candidatus Merdimorpha stercoravium]|uniref:HlyC/CorC family transporter n=1 Tax=Candidatus Merdimorpha stercoravium TaxID=2840863 RepID=A0A9D1H9H0_9FLAO|nr:HlyC/CorC family transporter [Candidatus Merdimorpha stercoravium]